MLTNRNNLTAAARMAVLLPMLMAISASAVEINVVYDAANSVAPASDPNGTRLMAVVNAAASRWEDIIEDGHTMTLNISYDDPANVGGGTAAAVAPVTTATANRTETGRILFSNAPNWYFDETPLDDVEYNLQQTLYRDLPLNTQANHFNATVAEDLLEVGYRGFTNSSAPPEAQNGLDVLFVAMHEIGHHLGVTNQLIGARAEWADGDYDFDSNLMGGAIMAAETSDGFGHLDSDTALLGSGGASLGFRRLPTATDVFAAAAVGQWSQIDLQRQDFLSGDTWGTASNWMGNQMPGAFDSAYIRHGDGVDINQNRNIRNLTVTDDSSFSTLSNKLDASRTVSVSEGGEIFVGTIAAQGELEATTVDVNNRGKLTLLAGGLVDAVDVNINTLGEVSGWGTVDVEGLLVNNGTITSGIPIFGGDLTLQAFGGGRLDLDGTGLENGRIEAVSGNLIVNASLTDKFDGTAVIYQNRSMTFLDVWEMAGNMEMRGAFGNNAELHGGTVQISGRVTATGLGNFIHPRVHFENGALVMLPGIADALRIGDDTHPIIVNGNTNVLGEGRYLQWGDMTVNNGAHMNIGVRSFDWDGAGDASTTLTPGSTLTINVEQLEDDPGGVITVDNATLNVTVGTGSWNLENQMIVSGTSQLAGSTINVKSGAVMSMETGQAMVDAIVDNSGLFRVNGSSIHQQGIYNRVNGSIEIGPSGFLHAPFIENDGDFNFGAGRMSVAQFHGDLENIDGTVAPGNSPGIMSVVGDYAQFQDATLEMEIEGLQPGSGYDVLDVQGTATLDGLLKLITDGGNYTEPSQGEIDRFTLLIADDIVGSFDEVVYNDDELLAANGVAANGSFVADAGNGLFRLVEYSDTEVNVSNYGALPGDANLDGTVDGQDFIVWNENKFTGGADWFSGDFNGDGTADGQDFILWNDYKFTSAVQRTMSAVPEPGCFAMLGFVGLTGLSLRRRWA